jgi:GNAT superfamily N-acetyltransferase
MLARAEPLKVFFGSQRRYDDVQSQKSRGGGLPHRGLPAPAGLPNQRDCTPGASDSISQMSSQDQYLERMAGSLRAWQRAVGASAAGGSVLEVGEAVGSIVPAVPDRSILNTIAGPRGMQWESHALDQAAARYQAAGVRVWGLWAHERDQADALREKGLVIDSRPTAMAMDLSQLSAAPELQGVRVQRTDDLAALAQPLGAGYGFPARFLVGALPGLLDRTEAWLAHVDGAPAAGLLIVTCEGDAGVFMVATAPELRGRGAASAALHHALLHAREQGCSTSTLQASDMGRTLYARLGYEDLGRYLLWEHRTPESTGQVAD